MKLDIFGRKEIEVVRRNDEWLAFYPGDDGKRRKAEGIFIPGSLSESEVIEFIADIFHEWATPSNTDVKVVSIN